MVSKIAVIALVAIVAAPILLGYGMSLSEVTETKYDSGTTTNVTELITNSTAYTYMNMNIYQMNTINFAMDSSNNTLKQFTDTYKVLPEYSSVTAASTSLPLDVTVTNTPADIADLTDYQFYQLSTEYDYDRPNDFQLGVRVHLTYNNSWSGWANRVSLVTWDPSTSTIFAIYHVNTNQTLTFAWTGVDALEYQFVNYTADATVYTTPADGITSTFADMASGYKMFHNDTLYNNNDAKDNNWWVPPSVVSSAMLTIDLSDMTDDLTFNTLADNNTNQTITATRTVDGGDVSWSVSGEQLVYDNSASENVYQIRFTKTGTEWYYVGSWPSAIGAANYYRNWSFDWSSALTDDVHFKGIQLVPNTSDYPRMRVDQAIALANIYRVIADKTYNPAQTIGSNNISTMIKSVSQYGSSLTFGGNTYTVNDRSITLGTHETSVNGLLLESVINSNGTYDNKINGYTISTTAQPSSITFNGTWLANVTSSPLISSTITKTEWIPGQFGWNGIDQNFLIVGLITCLGVFIALGIYARKSRSGGIIPLMIVTGCAAAVFFIMI